MDWKTKFIAQGVLKGVLTSALFFGVAVQAQDFNAKSYDLPLIFVNTNGQTIGQNEKISGTMRVLDLGTNLVSDSAKGDLLNIGIKVRGQTSATFPKKGYGVFFVDPAGADLKYSLLGLPEAEDWVFHGPYVDKTLIRNAIAHWLYRQTGRYSSRTKFYEMFVNGEYKGVYLLEEKIKRGKSRVDIAKLKETDVSGDDVTGGYIWSIDKVSNNSTQGLDQEGFKTKGGSPVVLRYPKKEKLAPEQLQYIESFTNKIEEKCTSGSITSSGCTEVVDLDAAVDYMMHQEITKNTDAFICSFYMFKDKDSKGGKMQMGAPWDFNLSLGAVSYSQGMDSTGWQIEYNAKSMSSGDYFVTKWEQNIWKDAAFKESFKNRWAELRSGVWHTRTINHFVDSLKTVLKNAADRNFERWPNLGKASGMNDPDPLSSSSGNGGNNGGWGFGGFGGGFGFGMTMNGYSEPTWDAEVEHVRKYLMARIRWIDGQMAFTEPAEPVVVEVEEPALVEELQGLGVVMPLRQNYYVRSGSSLKVYSSKGGLLELRNLNGQVLLRKNVAAGESDITLPVSIRKAVFIVTLNGKMISK